MCSLRGAAFEDGSDAAACEKCDGQVDNWNKKVRTYKTCSGPLALLPIRFRAQFKVLVLTYKALHGLGRQYLTERLSRHEPTRTPRSTSKVFLRVPTPREARRIGTRERSAFSVVAPRLWNDLPEEARLAPTLLSFWHQVKTYLFSQALNNVCWVCERTGEECRIP